jgi:ATP-dependent Clp protease ATP-binding subunit ClpA
MFERFTERARQVVVLAQDEARALRHNYIGTEHLLLGLIREEEGIAAGVLETLGVTFEDVRAHVARIVGSASSSEAGEWSRGTRRAQAVANAAANAGAAGRCAAKDAGAARGSGRAAST